MAFLLFFEKEAFLTPPRTQFSKISSKNFASTKVEKKEKKQIFKEAHFKYFIRMIFFYFRRFYSRNKSHISYNMLSNKLCILLI